ncbi:MAG: hypothetical protein AAEJ65_08750 [Planctomycetota bacterium]|jgi:hypothetical protein
MISLIEQHVDPERSQKLVIQRVREYIQTGRPLDHAPESVLQDIDQLWERLQRAKRRGVPGVRFSRELHLAARARAFARAIAPMPDPA